MDLHGHHPSPKYYNSFLFGLLASRIGQVKSIFHSIATMISKIGSHLPSAFNIQWLPNALQIKSSLFFSFTLNISPLSQVLGALAQAFFLNCSLDSLFFRHLPQRLAAISFIINYYWYIAHRHTASVACTNTLGLIPPHTQLIILWDRESLYISQAGHEFLGFCLNFLSRWDDRAALCPASQCPSLNHALSVLLWWLVLFLPCPYHNIWLLFVLICLISIRVSKTLREKKKDKQLWGLGM